MAKTRRIIFISIPVLLLGLLIFLIFRYMNQDKKGALQVTSTPDSKVYLNDEYLGQTPLCRCPKVGEMVKTGEYTIRLVPVEGDFSEYQEKITVSEAVYTVVDRKFGNDSLSEGSVISLSPLADKTKTELIVLSFPKGS